jgi:two-component system chemotaxis response regulator CheB
VTLRALELGAVDFVAKPKIDVAGTLSDYADEITTKVKVAARARVMARSSAPPRVQNVVVPKFSADAVLPAGLNTRAVLRTTEKVIAIGASTGGTEALRELISALPPHAPAIVISQHIPAAFSGPFAERLNRASAMAVCEAQSGQYLLPGHVYVAPGDRHLIIERDGARYRCKLSDGPQVNRHRPSVDVMFRSVAQNLGPNAIGVILTGMGDDGARGLKEMRDAGAQTIAQDEQTSVVWGMPGSAVKMGAAEQVLPLQQIPAQLVEMAMRAERNATAANSSSR